jgi:hypothetical protein
MRRFEGQAKRIADESREEMLVGHGLILSLEYCNASMFQSSVGIVAAELSTEKRGRNFSQIFLELIPRDRRDPR